MRKALIGFLLGATMATPMAAYARPDDSNSEVRAQRVQQQQARSAQRSESRQGHSQQRTERTSTPRTEVAVNAGVSTRRGDNRDRNWTGRTDRRPDQSGTGSTTAVSGDVTARRGDNRPRTWTGRTQGTETAVPRTEDRARNWPGQTDRTRRVVSEQGRRDDWRNDRNDRTDNRRGDWNGRNDRRGDWNGRNDNRRNNWNRNWRNDNRYDWQRWRSSNRSIFHIGTYYSPYRDYSYSRFSIGYRLGSSFYSDRYWINDPWQYRLPPAYSGTRWIRYYNDVLLVDMYTGEVVDVIYDFFW